MKIKMEVTGVADMILRLRNIADKVPENSRKVMDRAGDRIVKNAQAMAPRDQGYLEESIRRENQYEEERRGRKTVVVMFGGMTAPDGTDVSEYAMEVHENYDNRNMGPNSVAKQQGQTLQIGRHFLTRAFEMEKGLPSEIEASINQTTRHYE